MPFPDGRGARPVPRAPLALRVVAYEVQTEVFEGPFDLLLHLILREQVDLYEVRLSRIVQFGLKLSR